MVCAMDIGQNPSHVHTDACFVEIKPLSVVEFFQSQGCAACALSPNAEDVESLLTRHADRIMSRSTSHPNHPQGHVSEPKCFAADLQRDIRKLFFISATSVIKASVSKI